MCKKTLFLLLISLLSLFLANSCQKKVFYEKIDPLPDEVWHIDSLLHYDFTIEDTLACFNMYINIRNSVDFETQNFYIFMTTTFPNGDTAVDTLGCFISDIYGKWTGKGLGRVRENRFLFKSNIRFPQKGNYHIDVQQAMRADKVKGIVDFGISLNYFDKDKTTK